MLFNVKHCELFYKCKSVSHKRKNIQFTVIETKQTEIFMFEKLDTDYESKTN